jgi:8-oxo-dGTP pyrophosphatase MutT (NUDIX family)
VQTRNEASAGGVVFRADAAGGIDVAIIRTHEGRWQLPKGWIEAGEPPEATACREVREEAGIEAETVAPLDTIDYWFVSHYDDEPARVHKTVQFFLLRYLDGSTDDHDDEVTDARFVAIDEAERMLAFKDERRMIALARQMLAEAASRLETT